MMGRIAQLTSSIVEESEFFFKTRVFFAWFLKGFTQLLVTTKSLDHTFHVFLRGKHCCCLHIGLMNRVRHQFLATTNIRTPKQVN